VKIEKLEDKIKIAVDELKKELIKDMEEAEKT
jgi:hypothetical protein